MEHHSPQFPRYELPAPPSQIWDILPVKEALDTVDLRFPDKQESRSYEPVIVNNTIGGKFRIETRITSSRGAESPHHSYIVSIWDARSLQSPQRSLDDYYCLTHYPASDENTAKLMHHAVNALLSLSFHM